MRMRIAINRSMGIPLATQIRDQIVAAIASRALRAGDRLPTIRQLAEYLLINRNTVAQVYRQLEAEGYLTTRAGGGTTVADTAATTDAIRADALRTLVTEALRGAVAAGFTAREFAELAYYESAQQPARPTILVTDEYPGELIFLAEAVGRALPAATVHALPVADLAALSPTERAARLSGYDFAVAPFYCVEQVRALCELPVLAAGAGPSLKMLERIRGASTGKNVAIVCSEPAGPAYMETSLRRAGIPFGAVTHTHLAHPDLARTLATADLIIASEGSIDKVESLAPGQPIVTYSAILSDESMATIRQYAEQGTDT
jgi:GntR family transcriptional regulator